MISEELGLAYVHIPKTAGMSIARAFGVQWSVELQKQAHEFRALRESGYLSFAVVRDPVDRIVSAYRYMTSKPYYYDRPIMGGPDRQMSFESWWHYNVAEYQGDLRHTDSGGKQTARFGRGSSFWFSPQVYWLLDADGQLDVDRLIRFADLPSAVELLLAEQGCHDRLPHANRAKARGIVLPVEVEREVKEFYAADYRLLEWMSSTSDESFQLVGGSSTRAQTYLPIGTHDHVGTSVSAVSGNRSSVLERTGGFTDGSGQTAPDWVSVLNGYHEQKAQLARLNAERRDAEARISTLRATVRELKRSLRRVEGELASINDSKGVRLLRPIWEARLRLKARFQR